MVEYIQFYCIFLGKEYWRQRGSGGILIRGQHAPVVAVHGIQYRRYDDTQVIDKWATNLSYHGGGQEHEHKGHQGQVQEADD